MNIILSLFGILVGGGIGGSIAGFPAAAIHVWAVESLDNERLQEIVIGISNIIIVIGIIVGAVLGFKVGYGMIS